MFIKCRQEIGTYENLIYFQLSMLPTTEKNNIVKERYQITQNTGRVRIKETESYQK